jgi:uncharacterized protein (TIGR00303 family)
LQDYPYHDIRVIGQTESSRIDIPTNVPIFICVISHTDTSSIPGITAAGANPELVKYTPAADAEFLHYGFCKCTDKIPITPEGIPSPVLISRAALGLSKIPYLIVDAGCKIKPAIPFISFGLDPGQNIETGQAVDRSAVKKAFEYGKMLGEQLGSTFDLMILGESIPGGTTTTLAVLHALGIDARNKVSSSMQLNPHQLKNEVLNHAILNSGISFAELRDNPVEAISLLGDPMMPAMAGISQGVVSVGGSVLLSGGTQMVAVLGILKSLETNLQRVFIGTTVYVANDSSSDLLGLVRSISKEVRVLAADLHMQKSTILGLTSFSNGFVKEGVGAGGVSIAAMLKSKGNLDGYSILRATEKEYQKALRGH